MKYTTEDFKIYVNNETSGEYELIGEYINSKIKTKILHKICNKTFDMAPGNFKYGQRCPHCKNVRIANSQKLSVEEVNSKIDEVWNGEFSLYGNYINAHTKTEFIHNKCNTIFSNRLSDVLRHFCCNNPECVHKNISDSCKDTFNIFLDKFNKRSNGEYELISDEYISSYDKVKIKHLKCLRIFEMTPNNFLNWQGCPNCNMSKGEQLIKKWLTDNNIEYISQKEFDNLIGLGGGNLSYDFYIPYQNKLIEFQGEQHYYPNEHFGGLDKFKIQQEHDNLKRQYAINNNIELLEIKYTDIKKISDILNNYINIPNTN